MTSNKKVPRDKSTEPESRSVKEEPTVVKEEGERDDGNQEEGSVPEDDLKLEMDTDEPGVWTAETEAKFFLAADEFPPSGVTYPLQCFNLRMVCGECVPLSEPEGDKTSRLLTASESFQHALRYWNTKVDPDSLTTREATERALEHRIPHYVVPKEYRRTKTVRLLNSDNITVHPVATPKKKK